MVESVWLDEGDEIVPKVFMDSHTNGNCITIKKIREVIDRLSKIVFVAEYPQNKAGMVIIDNSEFIEKLKEELGLEEE